MGAEQIKNLEDINEVEINPYKKYNICLILLLVIFSILITFGIIISLVYYVWLYFHFIN